jgi:hypothetical protein
VKIKIGLSLALFVSDLFSEQPDRRGNTWRLVVICRIFHDSFIDKCTYIYFTNNMPVT